MRVLFLTTALYWQREILGVRRWLWKMAIYSFARCYISFCIIYVWLHDLAHTLLWAFVCTLRSFLLCKCDRLYICSRFFDLLCKLFYILFRSFYLFYILLKSSHDVKPFILPYRFWTNELRLKNRQMLSMHNQLSGSPLHANPLVHMTKDLLSSIEELFDATHCVLSTRSHLLFSFEKLTDFAIKRHRNPLQELRKQLAGSKKFQSNFQASRAETLVTLIN